MNEYDSLFQYTSRNKRSSAGSMSKIASGTPADSNPKRWTVQVMRVLAEQHPYVDASDVKTSIDEIDPETSTARGKIILGNQSFIPFSINRNPRTRKPEIDPIDIIFSGGRFAHLNETSWLSSKASNPIGSTISRDDARAMGGKGGGQYVGGMTGDVSPMEYYPQMGAMPGASIKNSNLRGYGYNQMSREGDRLVDRIRVDDRNYYARGMSPRSESMRGFNQEDYEASYKIERLIRTDDDLETLMTMLLTHPSIMRGSEDTGLLEDILKQDNATSLDSLLGSGAVMIEPGPMATFMVRDSSGGVIQVPASELEAFVGQRAHMVASAIKSKGSYVLSLRPTIDTVITSSAGKTIGVIQRPGHAQVYDKDGRTTAKVCLIHTLDGTTPYGYRVITEKRTHAVVSKPLGVPLEASPDDTLSYYDWSAFVPGAKGVFCSTDKLPECTEIFEVKRVDYGPDQNPICAVVFSYESMTAVTVDFTESLIRPILDTDPQPRQGLVSYHVPIAWGFIPLGDETHIFKEGESVTIGGDRKVATLSPNLMGGWSITGEARDGSKIRFVTNDASELRVKLAAFGLGEEDAAEAMGSRRRVSLYDVWPDQVKVATHAFPDRVRVGPRARMLIGSIKTAAAEMAEGVDEMAPSVENDQDKRNIIEATIISSFAGEDHILNLIEAIPKLEDCEDTIARALLASRCGVSMIDPSGARKALQGISKTIQSLRQLEAIGVDA